MTKSEMCEALRRFINQRSGPNTAKRLVLCWRKQYGTSSETLTRLLATFAKQSQGSLADQSRQLGSTRRLHEHTHRTN
jgi:hypothetical protein